MRSTGRSGKRFLRFGYPQQAKSRERGRKTGPDESLKWSALLRPHDGSEVLALIPFVRTTKKWPYRSFEASDLEWVAFTPDGFCTSSSGANSALHWITNNGEDHEADDFAAADVARLRRPDILAYLLEGYSTYEALGHVEFDSKPNTAARREVRRQPYFGSPSPTARRLLVDRRSDGFCEAGKCCRRSSVSAGAFGILSHVPRRRWKQR
jgi:hypothetical protein